MALIILGAIGWFDCATGYDLHVFAFYFLPVWLIAWHVGLRSGMYMALLAAGTWFALSLPRLRELVRPIYIERGILAAAQVDATTKSL